MEEIIHQNKYFKVLSIPSSLVFKVIDKSNDHVVKEFKYGVTAPFSGEAVSLEDASGSAIAFADGLETQVDSERGIEE